MDREDETNNSRIRRIMKIKIKMLDPMAVIPKYTKEGDAGLDLTATSKIIMTGNDVVADYIEYGTGLAIEIPEGFMGLLFPRSSISNKNMTLVNSVGVIDSGYRGEIKLRFKIDANYDDILDDEKNNTRELGEIYIVDNDNIYIQLIYEVGDRIAQLIILPVPEVEFEVTDNLSETTRKNGGFGHSGR